MPGRCKQERHPSNGQSLHNRWKRSLEVQAQSFQHIGGSDLATGTAIAVLGNLHAAGGSREGHGRGDIERVSTITTGAAGIDHRQGRTVTGQWTGLPQHRRHCRQLIRHHSLGPQTSQKRSGLDRFQIFRKPRLHQGRCIGGAEVLALQQMFQGDGPGACVRGHRGSGWQKKTRVRGTPGQVMGTLPLSLR